MALSVTNTVLDHPGGIRFSHGVITGDSSYVTGGEAITPDDLGFASAITSLVIQPSDTGYVARFDSANNTVEVFSSGDAVNTVTYVVDGAAAGNVTVTGVLLTDTLVSVVQHEAHLPQVLAVYAISGGTAGNHTVTGLSAGDDILGVTHHTDSGGAVIDLLSEFTTPVAGNNVAVNSGTDTSNDWLIITASTPEVAGTIVDRTGDFTIDSNNTIDNAGQTSSSGDRLSVVVSRATAFSEVDTSTNLSTADFSYVAIGY